MPVLTRAATATPPNKPMATANTAFAMAKFQPRAAAVITRVGGSIKGEESQNAMIAERGAPAAIRPVNEGHDLAGTKWRQPAKQGGKHNHAVFTALEYFRKRAFGAGRLEHGDHDDRHSNIGSRPGQRAGGK